MNHNTLLGMTKSPRSKRKMKERISRSSVDHLFVENKSNHLSAGVPTGSRSNKRRACHSSGVPARIVAAILFASLASLVQGQPDYSLEQPNPLERRAPDPRQPPGRSDLLVVDPHEGPLMEEPTTGNEHGSPATGTIEDRGRSTDRKPATFSAASRGGNSDLEEEEQDSGAVTPSPSKHTNLVSPPETISQIWSIPAPRGTGKSTSQKLPTNLPRDEPTSTPTLIPSQSQWSSPTGVLSPSQLPSNSPTTFNPSTGPSDAPSGTQKPSSEPSTSPSKTSAPSSIPSTSPSEMTTKPSTETSSVASESNKPSDLPSRSPTASATQHPSKILSGSPSDNGAPSALRMTSIPTNSIVLDGPDKSNGPSNPPSTSSVPSPAPSLEPSKVPSVSPTEASVLPSVKPSAVASSPPSTLPSSAPVPCPAGTFGPFCAPPPKITSVFPEKAYGGGGTVIRIDGINITFPGRVPVYGCYFSAAGHVGASLVANEAVECIGPSVSAYPPSIQSTLTIFVDGVPSNEVPFSFVDECQEQQCGSGFCSFGRCVCLPGFQGEFCEEELLGPVVETPPSLTILEHQHFEYNMVVSEGTSPIQWSIVGAIPLGLSINGTSGVLSWGNTNASSEPFKVHVKAHNSVSSMIVDVTFMVLPSYTVKVSTTSFALSHPSPPISFKIETLDALTLEPVGSKMAQIWIRKQDDDQVRKVETVTDESGSTVLNYLPYGIDKGAYVYGGMHPAYLDPLIQGEFLIRAIDVSTSYYTLSGNTNEKISVDDVFKFHFIGGVFSGLLVRVNGNQKLWDSLTVHTSLSADMGDSSSDVSLSITVESMWAISEVLEMTLESDEGDLVRFHLVVDIRERSPAFRVTPSSLDIYIPQGGPPVYQSITVENIGDFPSGVIIIEHPGQPILRSLSGSEIDAIDVDERRVVSFAFVGDDRIEVGAYFHGTIIFRSEDAVELLRYRASVVPRIETTLTVVAQDEASYFSDGKPNVSGATVEIQKSGGGSSQSDETNDLGVAVFEGLAEGVYEITVRKRNHRQFRTSVVLGGPGLTVVAFLQTDVVSYASAIIPIENSDVILVEVESKVDSFVPRPTVVWSPPRPDWEGILAGDINEIQITATNYGQVAAENVTISWPRYWENVEFTVSGIEQSLDGMFHLGNLPPDSAYSFLVKTKRLEPIETLGRVSRSTSNGVFLEPLQVNAGERFNIIFVPFDNPDDGQVYIQYNAHFLVEYIYNNATSQIYTPVYNDEEIVDFVIQDSPGISDAPETIPLFSANAEAEAGRSKRKSSVQCARQHIHQTICTVHGLQFEFCASFKGTASFSGFYSYSCGIPRIEVHDFFGETRTMSPGWNLMLSANEYGLLDCTIENMGKDHDEELSEESIDGIVFSHDKEIAQKSNTHIGGCRRKRESGARRLDGASEQRSSTFTSALDRELEGPEQTCSESEFAAVHREVMLNQDLFVATEVRVQRCIVEANLGGKQNLFLCLLSESVSILPLISQLERVLECLLESLSRRTGFINFYTQTTRFQTLISLLLLPYGGSLLDNYETSTVPVDVTRNKAFSSTLTVATADDSEEGRALSFQEIQELLQIAQGVPTATEIMKFAQTWNKSLLLWIQGVHREDDLPREYAGNFFDIGRASEQLIGFELARTNLIQEGFSGFTNAWTVSMRKDRIEEAKTLAGVCARVGLQIDPERTLAGAGFEVKLQISNPGVAPMENLSFTLEINPLGNHSKSALDVFVIEQTNLHKITDWDGTGTLAGDSTGQISLFILPLSAAAPEVDTIYEIGGVLTYSVEGKDYEQLLSSATVAVTPEAQLRLLYFHSREVIGDDPSTPSVEPSIPFQVGALVENKGRGDASNVELFVSRPEIRTTENMPSDFMIIESKIGNEMSSNSLGVDFGVIPGREKVATVWSIVASLRGTFSIYSTILKFNDSTEDDRVSLIEATEVYELSHIVRVLGEHPAIPNHIGFYDDGIGDFLVNLQPDPFSLPDTIFTSDGRQSRLSVDQVINKAVLEQPSWNAEDDSYEVVVQMESSANVTSDWVYIRFDDPLAKTDYVLKTVKRTDFDYILFPHFNAWQTSRVVKLDDGSTESLDCIHLFDFGTAPKYVLLYERQHRVSGLYITAITEHSMEVSWDAAQGATAYYVVFKPTLLSDRYSKAASTFTKGTSLTIPNLTPGTLYKVTVYAGHHDVYEKNGASVIESTLGISRCGNGLVEWGDDCLARMVDDLPSTLEPTSVPTTSPTNSKVATPTTPIEPVDSCPEEFLCNEGNNQRGGQRRFWISKYTTTGVCRARCVKENKFHRYRTYICGSTCGQEEPDPENELNTDAPSYTPTTSPVVATQPDAESLCPVEEQCTSGMSLTPGYWMSYSVGRTCTSRCMRDTLVPVAVDKGYVCGQTCGGDAKESDASTTRETPAMETEQNGSLQQKSPQPRTANIFRGFDLGA